MADTGTRQSLEQQGRRPSESAAVPVSSTPDRLNTTQRSAMHQYQRTQAETASPTRLIIMLYDGAIRFCTLAQTAMRSGQLEAQNTNLIKAQRIIGELMSSLNREAGGEIASNLFRIYTHLLEEMVTANLYDKLGELDQVLSILRDMRESWEEIDGIMSQDSKPVIAEPVVPEAVANSLLPPPSLSAQQRLMAKTARMLTVQRSEEVGSLPSRLGDRNA